MSHLKAGSGQSADANTEAAVRAAVESARAALGAEPKLAILGATVDHDAARVFAAARKALPGVAIHGATSSLGVLAESGVVMGPGGGVGVLLLSGGEGEGFAVGHASLADGARDAGRRAAEALLRGRPAGEKPRLVFIAATPGDEEDILSGIEDALPDVPVYGGSAADHAIEGGWSLFTDDGPRKEGVSLAALFGDVRIGAAFDGPYEPTAKTAIVTEATGRRVSRLGAEPASATLDGWLDGRIAGQARDGGNLLMQTALSPLGVALLAPSGAVFHRLLHPAVAHPGGAVDLFARAAPGTSVCLMQGSEESLVGLVATLVDRALAQGKLTRAEVRCGFLIYCAGCAGAIGPRLDEVMARLRGRLEGVPVLGFCTFGEQGFVPDLGNIHANLSVALVLLG